MKLFIKTFLTYLERTDCVAHSQQPWMSGDSGNAIISRL